jgi:hypothetical protein
MANPGKQNDNSTEPGALTPPPNGASAETNMNYADRLIEKLSSISDGALVFIGVLLIFLTVMSWPVGLLAIGSAVIWYVCSKRENIFYKVAAHVFISVTIGLVFFALLTVVFNLSAPDNSTDEEVRSTEYFLLNFYDMVKKLQESLTLVVTAGVVTILLIIDQYRQNTHSLKRFLLVKELISKLAIILLTITSFTFFSPQPPGHIAQDYHTRVEKRYRVLLRQKKGEVARYIAAKEIKEQIPQVNEASKANYAAFFTSIHRNSVFAGRRVTRGLVRDLLHPANQPPAINADDRDLQLPADGKIMTVAAGSKDERDRQISLLNTEETNVAAATALADNEALGVKEVFSKLFEHLSPGIEGIAGTYIDEMISETGDLIFEKTHKFLNKEGSMASMVALCRKMVTKLPELNVLNNTVASHLDFKDPKYMSDLEAREKKIFEETRVVEPTEDIKEREPGEVEPKEVDHKVVEHPMEVRP